MTDLCIGCEKNGILEVLTNQFGRDRLNIYRMDLLLVLLGSKCYITRN